MSEKSFFKKTGPYKLKILSDHINGKLSSIENSDILIDDISSLNNAGAANAKVYLGFGLDGDGSPAKEVMTLTQEGKVIIGGNAPTKTFEVKLGDRPSVLRRR